MPSVARHVRHAFCSMPCGGAVAVLMNELPRYGAVGLVLLATWMPHAAQAQSIDAVEDDLFWEDSGGCENIKGARLYLEMLPEGRHAAEARACLERLGQAAPAEARKKAPSTEIERLLEVCEIHFAADRLTTGVGGTAVDCYREVQSLDPANTQALEGLQRVFGKYAGWARGALERGDIGDARRYAAKLKELNPEAQTAREIDREIAHLERQAAEARENAERERREREARERAEAERKERERLLAEDDAAFARAEEARTAAAYEGYLRAWPSGRHAAEARKRTALAPGRVFQDCDECPEMVVVPAGSFTMGSPSHEEGHDDDEGPQHRVTIATPFAVGKHEVKFDEWDACTAAGGCGGYRARDFGWGRRQRPVINVSWEDAKAYVRWLSRRTGKPYRLLSEAEWEYVARARTAEPFHFGTTVSTDQANYNGNFTYGSGRKGRYRRETVPVGSFPANGFVLHDVHGNVREWVEDCWHDSYRRAPADGSAWTSGGDCEKRVLRDGSWNDAPRNLRAANRDGVTSGVRVSYVGFRVAQTLTR